MKPADLNITPRGRNAIITCLVFAFLFVCVSSFVLTMRLIGKPYPGFLVFRNNVVNLIWLPGWTGIESGIKGRDIIKAVNGDDVKDADELFGYVSKFKPGTILTYTVDRGGKLIDVPVPSAFFAKRDFILCYSIWTGLGIFFFVTGIYVFYLRPNLPAGRAFLFFGLVAGFQNASIWEHCATHFNNIPLYTLPLIGPSMLVLGLHFPDVSRWRKYLIPLLVVTTLPLMFLYRYTFSDVSNHVYVYRAVLINVAVTFALGVLIMSVGFIRSKEPVVRQKGKLVIWGFTLAMFGAGAVLVGVLEFKVLNLYYAALPVLLIPISLGYAVVKLNLFDVDLLIIRSTGYILLTALAVVGFFVVIGSMSMALQEMIGHSSQVAAVFATLAMVVIFFPLKKRVDNYIEKKYVRSRYEYKETIQKAFKILAGIIDLEELLYAILDTILGSIQIEKGLIFLKDKKSEKLRLFAMRDFSSGFLPVLDEVSAEGGDGASLDAGHPLLGYFASTEEPLQMNDIEALNLPKKDRYEIIKFMTRAGIVLAVPVIYEWRVTGMLGLGAKKAGMMYTAEDIEIIQTLVMQTSVSIENARKVQELKRIIELETTLGELKHINEMKDNFLAMVSHDLRTPMTSIKGYASLLHASPEQFDGETTKEYLEIIIDETDRLTRLINDILDLQRFEAGRVELDLKKLNIVALAKEAYSLFWSAADKKKISFEKDIPEEEMYIKGHYDRLHQVLSNLISNSVKFTPEGGTIKIALERVYGSSSPCVKVSVIDSGPGIKQEDMGKLFQKFHQVDNPVRKKEEGSGLGLALAREIIEYHGGHIGADSDHGNGSVFYFILDTID